MLIRRRTIMRGVGVLRRLLQSKAWLILLSFIAVCLILFVAISDLQDAAVTSHDALQAHRRNGSVWYRLFGIGSEEKTRVEVPTPSLDPDWQYVTKRTRNIQQAIKDSPLLYEGESPALSYDGSQSRGRLTMEPTGGRLGNLMFTYASLLGVAKARGMEAVLPANHELRQYFDLSAGFLDPAENTSVWEVFREQCASAYDYGIRDIEPTLDTKLVGYYQSWRYFRHSQDEVRSDFKFAKPILRRAVSIMRRAVEKHFPNLTRYELHVVGVHVRRGDMAEYSARQRGYTVADKLYVTSAMQYFSDMIQSRTLFIATTDDVEWSRQNLPRYLAPLVISTLEHPIVDMALLSLCDSVVMTVGTFGWWSAWLAGGRTVYYKRFPEPYSIVADDFRADDYFFPGWIGFDFSATS